MDPLNHEPAVRGANVLFRALGSGGTSGVLSEVMGAGMDTFENGAVKNFRFSVGERVLSRQSRHQGLVVDRWIIDGVWMPRSGQRGNQIERWHLYEVFADGGSISAEFEEDLDRVSVVSEQPV